MMMTEERETEGQLSMITENKNISRNSFVPALTGPIIIRTSRYQATLK
jgi:hypothetical protein